MEDRAKKGLLSSATTQTISSLVRIQSGPKHLPYTVAPMELGPVVGTDASNHGWGFSDSDGQFGQGVFTSHELRWHINVKEGYGLLWALRSIQRSQRKVTLPYMFTWTIRLQPQIRALEQNSPENHSVSGRGGPTAMVRRMTERLRETRE